MTRRHELQRRLRTLGEINDIMGSMRTLSLLETRKLARFLDCQRRVLQTQRAAAADFLAFYPLHRAAESAPHRAVVAIGSERGFCGDFNATVRDYVESYLNHPDGRYWTVIAVGRKLIADLEHLGDAVRAVDGASTADEVLEVLQALMAVLEEWLGRVDGASLTVIVHGGEQGQVQANTIIPAFGDLPAPARRFAYPPRLYLSPDTFFAELLRHYLFAQLHEMVFTSLYHEHHRRVQHLESATRRLEQLLEELVRESNALRQEEITEELQVILLGADLVKQA